MASNFKKTLGGIAQFGLPILGGVFGGPAGAAIGGAAGGALSGQKGGLKQAGIGAVAGYGGAKLFGGLGGGSGSNPLSSLGNLFGGSNAGNTSNASTSSFNPNPLGPVNWATGFQGAINPIAGSQTSSQSQLGLGGLSKNPLLLGLGTMFGSQLIKSPQVPQLPQSVIDFQSAAKAGNPLQNQASQALQQQLGQTQQNLGQPEIDALNRQYDLSQEQELKGVDSMYKSLRPGSDPLTDTSYQKDLGRVRDRYATLRADSVAQAQRQISNDFNSQRAQTIAQSIGLGQQQLTQLAQLSQFDLDRQLSQLNIDYQDKSALRNYILQLGGNITASQFQKNPFDSFNITPK